MFTQSSEHRIVLSEATSGSLHEPPAVVHTRVVEEFGNQTDRRVAPKNEVYTNLSKTGECLHLIREITRSRGHSTQIDAGAHSPATAPSRGLVNFTNPYDTVRGGSDIVKFTNSMALVNS